MALTPSSEEAFVREVDDELRRDQALHVWKRWGRWIIAGVVLGLAIFAGTLAWIQHQQNVAAEQGEKLQAAFEDVAAGKMTQASGELDAIAASKLGGYRNTARLAQANLALSKNDPKTAAARFAEVAKDESAPQALRELALIRQTSIEFDGLKPAVVVERLAPLAAKGSPWLGSAGELVAMANIRMGKRDMAVRMLRDMAAEQQVPDSIRQRAVQLADVLSTPATAAPAAAAPVEEKKAR